MRHMSPTSLVLTLPAVVVILAIVVLLVLSPGCTGPKKDKSPDPGPPTTGPVLVKVVSRDVTIVARGSADGPVYSVQSSGSGRTLVPDMTLDQLQANEPQLARHIQSMHANPESREIGAWAGLDLE